ncbi:MAG: HPr(Ser) kinase/phosphatase [Vicinamibacteria bacterium]
MKKAFVPRVAVSVLLSEEAKPLELKLLSGKAGLKRLIDRTRVQRPGLALTGFTRYLSPGRVQVLGGSESSFIQTLSDKERAKVVGRLMSKEICCVVVTRGPAVPVELKRASEDRGIPVFSTALDSTAFIKRLTEFLEDQLARTTRLHGVLIDVLGIGVLIRGESGIGKSECGLELVDRGHRLVSDDAVDIKATSQGLLGVSPAATRDHMEIRGLGILNIQDLYGVSAVSPGKKIDIVVRLETWNPRKSYDRLGLTPELEIILGVPITLLRLPVAPGRNVALLVELAAKNLLLRARGHDAAAAFLKRVEAHAGLPTRGAS